MRIFKEAFRLIEEKKVKKEINTRDSFNYFIIGKTDSYLFRIYKKVAAWFSQCGCHVGVSNTPTGLCKHTIAGIVTKFLEVNNLKLKSGGKNAKRKTKRNRNNKK